jgi:hypothetical protein
MAGLIVDSLTGTVKTFSTEASTPDSLKSIGVASLARTISEFRMELGKLQQRPMQS